MKRIGPRIILGILLILGGLLSLFDKLGFIRDASGIFWGFVFGVAGGFFMYIFLTNPSNWWAAFPAFTLLGLGIQFFLPEAFSEWGGLVFLGSIGLGFFAVYITSTERWWAMIPGGVLITLGIVSVISEVSEGRETGGLLFIGLGITFLLVALLPSPIRMNWAYIPAGVLIILGLLLGTPFFGLTEFVLPGAAIIGGILLIYFYFRKR